jgi:hypothetical protein
MQASTIDGRDQSKHCQISVFCLLLILPHIGMFGYTEAIAISNEHSKVLQSDIIRLQGELSESVMLLHAAEVIITVVVTVPVTQSSAAHQPRLGPEHVEPD